ncbi:MAG: transglycosylase SLT domain-containing protein [Ignavibacteria bacterium]|nr:transglycosylase SLT domain-containing protein [Ignavibacteria bacterium]
MNTPLQHIGRIATTVLLVIIVIFASLVPGRSERVGFTISEASCILDRLEPSVGRRVSEASRWEYFLLVKQFAHKYNVDYRMILAIITKESQFNHEAVSERGARGFMQIMPVTNAEVAEQLKLDSIDLPTENLRAGIYYFSKLYELFPNAVPDNRLRLALAAYNAGPSRVYDAQELTAYFGENPNAWESVQHFLPLLSKRYDSLHQLVWKDGRPPSGFCGRASETVEYVGEVMKEYKTFKTAM